MTLKLRHYAAATLASAGLVLAGCSSTGGGSTSDTSTQSPEAIAATVQNAVNETKQAGTAKFNGTVTTITKEDGISKKSMTGAYDLPNNSLEAEIEMGSSAAEIQVKIIHIGDITYAKVPALNELLGNKWLQADLSSLGVGDPLNPEEALKDITDFKDLTNAGPDLVGGVETTKYTGKINVDKALAEAGVSPSPSSEKGNAAVAVWVDAKGQVVQVETLLKTTVSGKESTIDTLIQFSDFGFDANIKAPPASKTIDLTSLISADSLGLGDLNESTITSMLGGLNIADVEKEIGSDTQLMDKIKTQIPSDINIDDPSQIVPDLEKRLDDAGGGSQ